MAHSEPHLIGPLLVGVDGGGTSCRATLLAGPDKARYDVVLGPANVSTDFDAALGTINAALAQLAEAAGLTMAELSTATAHLGLAGVMSPAIAARVAAHLPFAQVSVTDDRPTTIAGALGEADGVVAAIGTGSFIGRQVAGKIHGVGGWGFYIGDQSSGAWLLRRCLEEVMLSVDGFAPHTDLSRAILKEHGDDPGQIVMFSLNSQPSDYARLARDVVAAAEAGDALGARLMQEGAAYIRRALDVVGWKPTEAFCLTGGLGPAYARWLDLPSVTAKGTALEGALALAARASGAHK
ncbi:MAG: BadF/BadG/BcrA/BcrD ATPase family protein [Cypionkella sp.]|uniref:BadF/BadG/BcrA/BcrD ATPase family protein n=1 Tax=Cypionkella sp. TaxID=2811411 RepID=UPI002AB9716A|nr:BadF/BadG/BcrA/BcrD ATPase family protein [Cypionkella sp.]MDZ4312635.1 BadF/BadG/BcrA/BcrD ATPase family protein [Cypionkella sp.]